MKEAGLVALRALNGGLFVVLFSLLGTVLRPKRFAGLFGAAPSIALANLAVVSASAGASVAAVECRSMLYGAAGFVAYCAVESALLTRLHAAAASALSCSAWVAVAVGLYLGIG